MAFLSIACHDNPDDVKSYIARYRFDIPVVLSDNLVEKQYEVTGYPSKFLISPDGKMLPLRFGADWEKVVEQFGALSRSGNKPPAGNKTTLDNKMK